MQFALLIYESPEAFATRKNDDSDAYLSGWRAYYKGIQGEQARLQSAFCGSTM